MHKTLYLDEPESKSVALVLATVGPFFLVIPVLMSVYRIGLETDMVATSLFELFFQVVCLLLSAPYLWRYLCDSWWSLQANTHEIVLYGEAVGAMLLGYSVLIQIVYLFYPTDFLLLGTQSILPVLTGSLYLTNAYFISVSPVVGTICAVLLAPVATCCIFYCTVFAKGFNVRPGVGYLLVMAVTLVPRLFNAVSLWMFSEELMIYMFQLPVHLLCCWLYHKTETIWGPIFVQMAVNLVSCIFLLILF